jgi:hypothetical protein
MISAYPQYIRRQTQKQQLAIHYNLHEYYLLYDEMQELTRKKLHASAAIIGEVRWRIFAKLKWGHRDKYHYRGVPIQDFLNEYLKSI